MKITSRTKKLLDCPDHSIELYTVVHARENAMTGITWSQSLARLRPFLN